MRAAAARGKPPGPRVFEQAVDRLRGVLLVRADDAGRPALDPARAVEAGDGAPSSSSTRPPSFGIVPLLSSKGARGWSCPDSRRCGRRSPQGITSLSSVGTARTLPRPSTSSRFRTISMASTRSVPVDRDAATRGSEGARCGASPRARARELAQDLDIPLDDVRGVLELGSRSPDRARGRRDRRARPHRPGRRAPAARSTSRPPAPARAGRARGSPGCPEPTIASIAASVVSVGRELLPREREHPRDVERDVPVPDDDRTLAREVELEVLEVRVAVVPGDELGRRPRAREGPRPGSRAGGRSASRPRRRRRRRCAASSSCADVPPDLDVAEEAEAGAGRDLLERA